MNDEEKSLLTTIETSVSSNSARIAIIQLKSNKNIDALSRLVFTIKKVLVGISFVLAIIITRIFGWSWLNHLLNTLSQLQFHVQLSEGYQVLILGLVTAIASGIIAIIIGHMMTVKIKDFLNKTKNEVIKK